MTWDEVNEKMDLLSQLVFLQKSKEDLLDKLNDASTSYSQYVEISNGLRIMNREINKIKSLAYDHWKSIS
jgi:uncharacterized protein YlxW (UPF0749 family)